MNLRKLKRKIQKALFAEQWSLLLCDADGKLLTHIKPPADRIWADPFPVEHEGKLLIFIEQQFRNRNGTLGYIEIFDDLTHSPFVPVLEKPHHLSYPNVFPVESGASAETTNRTWYMIPETHEGGSIDLYRAESFPDKWVFDSTLLTDVCAVDTSIFQHGGLWWLFTSIAGKAACAGPGGSTMTTGLNDSLFLYSSRTFPSTEWTPHPMNPVVRGRGNARMAGAPWTDPASGNIYRPAQSCVREYGERLIINRMEELTESTYVEKPLTAIEPEKELHAVCTHTINRSGRYVVRDIKTRRFRLWS